MPVAKHLHALLMLGSFSSYVFLCEIYIATMFQLYLLEMRLRFNWLYRKLLKRYLQIFPKPHFINILSVQCFCLLFFDQFGGIDILINNASAIALQSTLDIDMKRYDLMHNINARGTFLV